MAFVTILLNRPHRLRRFIYFKALFSCKKHQGKIYKTQRVLVANLATNFWILVASTIILVALATVLGAISCPAFSWFQKAFKTAAAKMAKKITNRLNSYHKHQLKQEQKIYVRRVYFLLLLQPLWLSNIKLAAYRFWHLQTEGFQNDWSRRPTLEK